MDAGFNKTIVQFKALFFDPEKVLYAVNKAIVKNLNYIGGYVAKVARNSIKKASSRHQASWAGRPPLSHTGILKKNIYYGYQPMHQSVIVGPALLGTKSKGSPAALEYGGVSSTLRKGKWQKVKVRARPFMHPALLNSQNKIADIWKDSVKK